MRGLVLDEGAARAWKPFLRASPAGVSRFARRDPSAAAGLVILAIFVIAAVFAPVVAPHDPLAPSYGDRLTGPSGKFWLGTDEFGRDTFSRTVWAARVSLGVAATSVILGQGIGLIVGLLSGWFGGAVDALVQRLVDALMSLPGLVLALAIIAAVGASITGVIVAIAIGQIAVAARVTRAAVLSVKAEEYVEAARALGASDIRIVFRHLLPNSFAPALVLTTLAFGGAILVEASLSFLGLGIPPPNPTWGGMLSGAATKYINESIWLLVAPGFAIAAAVYAFNMVGDALRDTLDPRTARRRPIK